MHEYLIPVFLCDVSMTATKKSGQSFDDVQSFLREKSLPKLVSIALVFMRKVLKSQFLESFPQRKLAVHSYPLSFLFFSDDQLKNELIRAISCMWNVIKTY